MFPDEVFDACNGLYIDNITLKLEKLYTDITDLKLKSSKEDMNFNTSTYLDANTEWFAIIKYFEWCWKIICNKGTTRLDKLYLVFVVPNEWFADSDIIEELMIPLLTQSGVTFPHTEGNYRSRVQFVSKLEASISFLQLRKDIQGTLPAFIQNENKCVLYELHKHGTAFKLTASYIHIKEDYNLKLNDEHYYTLKHVSKNKISLFSSKEFDSILHKLQQYIFKTVLKVEDSILKQKYMEDGIFRYFVQNTTNTNYQTVGEFLLNAIFSFFNGDDVLDKKTIESM